MTAEIAILNRGAVAMAADSAVTIRTPTGPKIYESVNKLFALIKNRPVGTMIFDSADLIGMPWETIIKTYRMDRAKYEAKTLREYADDFLDFLTDSPALLGPSLQLSYLEQSVFTRISVVREAIDEKVKNTLAGGGRRSLGRARLVGILDATLVEFEDMVASLDTPDWASGLDLAALHAAHAGLLDKAVDDIFQALPLGVRRRKRLIDAVIKWLGKNANFEPRSGLVIAGFGSEQYFPGLLEFTITGLFEGKLRVSMVDDFQIDPDMYAIIKPFAQRDVVDSFMAGMSPQLESALRGYIESALKMGVPDLAEQTVQSLIPGAPKDVVKARMATAGEALFDDLMNTMRRLGAKEAMPIIESVGFLPKDELAAMAESLVNLTSLKRRVSISEAQTVGGPVDVAVISRGDGFVWIKRKHYFDAALNPAWSMTHAGARP